MFFTASEEEGNFFLDASSDTAGQYTKDERTSRFFHLIPGSLVKLLIEQHTAGPLPFPGLNFILPRLNFVSARLRLTLFFAP